MALVLLMEWSSDGPPELHVVLKNRRFSERLETVFEWYSGTWMSQEVRING